MFIMTILVPLFMALLSAVSANNAVVVNNCGYDLWAWTIDADHRTPAPYIINRQSIHYDEIRVPSSGGVSIKLSTTNTGSPMRPVTQLEYTVDVVGNRIWYDISFVDCATGPASGGANCPVWKDGLSVVCASGNCRKFTCPASQECPSQVYYDSKATAAPEQPNSNVAGTGGDIRYTLCGA
ncbi:hypothetical protein EJ05DRAFT_521184 [Pseudovirgaria hyperparasitica]|uniref:Osmotin, thaumatin-like protein n=1 Tax=Pseudovirgaria hyperparasitica TaxID=470096 RepID=A0A6A6VVY6_9PEZI|nr:uncharacterized protein EJ05DRAFT_521184 [Pseudovirgaria hyperparasitica]KAF2753874.1 hypothetical protein EJ05DRAFT_521184 [Pseudovirgaria hyperparasitica]